MATLTQGRAAMWIDGVGWAPPIEDPNASRVVGKIGYTVVPAGPKGQFSAAYGDGIGIAKTSTKKEAAYLYCQWAVSKTMGARLLQSGGGGLLQFLAERPDFAPAGGRAVITGVTARSRSRPRSIDISAIPWFDDPVALATSPDTDIFVELVGGSDGPAKAAGEAALRAAMDKLETVVAAGPGVLWHALILPGDQIRLLYISPHEMMRETPEQQARERRLLVRRRSALAASATPGLGEMEVEDIHPTPGPAATTGDRGSV
eukprot:gene10742-14406_t